MKSINEFKTDLIEIALAVASGAHIKQVRKGSGLPYIIHPVGVAELVNHYGGTEEQIIAALLHDTIEDTNLTYEDIANLFGNTLADLVEELTSKKEDLKLHSTKADYLLSKMYKMSYKALFIKLADRIDNITGIAMDNLKKEFKVKYLKETDEIIQGISPHIIDLYETEVIGVRFLIMYDCLIETWEKEMDIMEGR